MPQSKSNKPCVVWKPKLHDKVLTPSGIGIVEKISGDMYLIDLENQVAQIWERLSSLKLPG